MKDRQKGILVALLGILCISPDAVTVRFLSGGGIPPFVIIFWRLLISCCVSFPYALYETGGLKGFVDSVVAAKYYFLAGLVFQTSVDILFPLCFVYASAANALLLINLNPLWCAVLGRYLLGDELPLHTIIALVLALGCMALIFVPDIVSNQQEVGDEIEEDDDEIDQGTLLYSPVKGNILSVITGIMLALFLTTMRKGGKLQLNLVGTAPIAGLLGAMIGLIVEKGDVSPTDVWEGELLHFWLATIGQGLALGTVFVCLCVAPRLATGAEVALVLLLEVVLGPLWVFVAYGDIPPIWTLIGGSILLAILAFHESIPLFVRAHGEMKQMSSRFSTTKHIQEEEIANEGVDVTEGISVPDPAKEEANHMPLPKPPTMTITPLFRGNTSVTTDNSVVEVEVKPSEYTTDDNSKP